ncbi:MAG: hypothetical protein IJF46_04755 [Bacteroidaceae bacterium]|nr:hypothetical protein [Bacteroidaceae bacterium]
MKFTSIFYKASAENLTKNLRAAMQALATNYSSEKNILFFVAPTFFYTKTGRASQKGAPITAICNSINY